MILPHKMRNCNKCSKDVTCGGSDILVNQRKDFSANLSELEQKTPNEFGHMLPWYETI